MSEADKRPTTSRQYGIPVPVRYAPGEAYRFFDDFIELAAGPMPPQQPLEDGSKLALTKYYLVACCPVAGAYSLPDGFLNLISDCADTMAAKPDKDIFLGRQKGPVALAMKEAVTLEFEHPRKAIASLYLATQFEFYFRLLSGLLNPDGSWKSPADQQKAKLLLPQESRLSQRSISNVEVVYKLMVLNNADPRASLLNELDAAIRSRFRSQL